MRVVESVIHRTNRFIPLDAPLAAEFTDAVSHFANGRIRDRALGCTKGGYERKNMEFIFEVVLQFLSEVLFQLVLEGLFRLGLRSLGETFGRPRGTVWGTVGFILWGAMAGGISLLILPSPFLHSPVLRIANLILTPVAVAAIMMGIGRRRRRKGRNADALDRFSNAYFFALAMTSVRFLWAV